MRLQETLAAEGRHVVGTEDGTFRLSIMRPKGSRRARARTIVLSPEAVSMLPLLGSERLFSHFDPKRSNNVSTQWGHFRESRAEGGMPRFRLHDLRHAYAVSYLRANPTRLRPLPAPRPYVRDDHGAVLPRLPVGGTTGYGSRRWNS